MGGLLSRKSLAAPFSLAAGVALVALIVAALCLPESLPAGARSARSGDRPSLDKRAWQEALSGPLARRFILTFISTSGMMIFATIFGLCALERIAYGTKEVGIIMMVLGIGSALAQGVLVSPLSERPGEHVVIEVGLAASAIGFVLILLVDTYVGVLTTTAFFGIAVALQLLALMSLTSQQSTQSQGVIMGISNSFVSLGRIAGPALGGAIFDLDIRLPYILGAAVMFGGFAVSTGWFGRKPASRAL